MNCLQCQFHESRHTGYLEVTCALTGGQVPVVDLNEGFACPITLPLESEADCVAAIDVLRTAQERGRLEDLIAAYPERHHELLRLLLNKGQAKGLLRGRAKSESQELAERLVEMGASPEMAGISEEELAGAGA